MHMPIATAVQSLSAIREHLWPRGPIEVCWEDETFFDDQAECRARIRNAVESTWGAAFAWDRVPEDQRMRFVGWTRCSEGNNHGLRIRNTAREYNGAPICDLTAANCDLTFSRNPGWPRAYLGDSRAGEPNNIYLRCAVPTTGPDAACPGAHYNPDWTTGDGTPLIDRVSESAANCDYWTAAHEFGHALGLTHETERPDATGCQPDVINSPDVLLGPYDHDSIMGCGHFIDNGRSMGPLEDSDIEWIRALYYPEYSDAVCAVYGRSEAPLVTRAGDGDHHDVSGLEFLPSIEAEAVDPRPVLPAPAGSGHAGSGSGAEGAGD